MSDFGTLTIRLEFVSRRDGKAYWSKNVTLVTSRNVTQHDARLIADEFKSANEQFSQDMLHIIWQADPVFIS
jgi:hypothetical protein